MDARLTIVAGAAVLGLLVGGGLWAVSGGETQESSLAALDTRLDAVSTGLRHGLDRPSDALAQSQAMPLFGALEGVDEPRDLVVRLAGLVRSPARTAALIAIGEGPTRWFSIGEEHDGVMLRSVSGGSVTVMTANGEREVPLGAGAPPSASAGISPVSPGSDQPPPGYRAPPPPASAPGVR